MNVYLVTFSVGLHPSVSETLVDQKKTPLDDLTKTRQNQGVENPH